MWQYMWIDLIFIVFSINFIIAHGNKLCLQHKKLSVRYRKKFSFSNQYILAKYLGFNLISLFFYPLKYLLEINSFNLKDTNFRIIFGKFFICWSVLRQPKSVITTWINQIHVTDMTKLYPYDDKMSLKKYILS